MALKLEQRSELGPENNLSPGRPFTHPHGDNDNEVRAPLIDETALEAILANLPELPADGPDEQTQQALDDIIFYLKKSGYRPRMMTNGAPLDVGLEINKTLSSVIPETHAEQKKALTNYLMVRLIAYCYQTNSTGVSARFEWLAEPDPDAPGVEGNDHYIEVMTETVNRSAKIAAFNEQFGQTRERHNTMDGSGVQSKDMGAYHALGTTLHYLYALGTVESSDMIPVDARIDLQLMAAMGADLANAPAGLIEAVQAMMSTGEPLPEAIMDIIRANEGPLSVESIQLVATMAQLHEALNAEVPDANLIGTLTAQLSEFLAVHEGSEAIPQMVIDAAMESLGDFAGNEAVAEFLTEQGYEQVITDYESKALMAVSLETLDGLKELAAQEGIDPEMAAEITALIETIEAQIADGAEPADIAAAIAEGMQGIDGLEAVLPPELATQLQTLQESLPPVSEAENLLAVLQEISQQLQDGSIDVETLPPEVQALIEQLGGLEEMQEALAKEALAEKIEAVLSGEIALEDMTPELAALIDELGGMDALKENLAVETLTDQVEAVLAGDIEDITPEVQLLIDELGGMDALKDIDSEVLREKIDAMIAEGTLPPELAEYINEAAHDALIEKIDGIMEEGALPPELSEFIDGLGQEAMVEKIQAVLDGHGDPALATSLQEIIIGLNDPVLVEALPPDVRQAIETAMAENSTAVETVTVQAVVADLQAQLDKMDPASPEAAELAAQIDALQEKGLNGVDPTELPISDPKLAEHTERVVEAKEAAAAAEISTPAVDAAIADLEAKLQKVDPNSAEAEAIIAEIEQLKAEGLPENNEATTPEAAIAELENRLKDFDPNSAEAEAIIAEINELKAAEPSNVDPTTPEPEPMPTEEMFDRLQEILADPDALTEAERADVEKLIATGNVDALKDLVETGKVPPVEHAPIDNGIDITPVDYQPAHTPSPSTPVMPVGAGPSDSTGGTSGGAPANVTAKGTEPETSTGPKDPAQPRNEQKEPEPQKGPDDNTAPVQPENKGPDAAPPTKPAELVTPTEAPKSNNDNQPPAPENNQLEQQTAGKDCCDDATTPETAKALENDPSIQTVAPPPSLVVKEDGGYSYTDKNGNTVDRSPEEAAALRGKGHEQDERGAEAVKRQIEQNGAKVDAAMQAAFEERFKNPPGHEPHSIQEGHVHGPGCGCGDPFNKAAKEGLENAPRSYVIETGAPLIKMENAYDKKDFFQVEIPEGMCLTCTGCGICFNNEVNASDEVIDAKAQDLRAKVASNLNSAAPHQKVA